MRGLVKGFTLIEIMVALAVLSLTMSSSYTLYQSLTSGAARQVEQLQIIGGVRDLSQRLSKDIRQAGFVAPAATNHVDATVPAAFSTNLLVSFEAPSLSYGLDFEAEYANNADISFTSPGIVSVPENTVILIDLSSLFTDDDSLSYELVERGDYWAFVLCSDGTSVCSLTGLDFELPLDEGANNTYQLTVRATDANGHGLEQVLEFVVTDMP